MTRDIYETPVQYIKGIGPRRAKLLQRLGIKTLLDALYYLPFRYEDRCVIRKIAEVAHEGIQTVEGEILSSGIRSTSRFKIFELLINDGSGLLTGKWFNQPYMEKLFRKGDRVLLSGIVRMDNYRGGGYEMHNPDFEVLGKGIDKNKIHTSRIVPFYRTTAGLGTRTLRSIMFSIIGFASEKIDDFLPEYILKRYNLPSLGEALRNVHFPEEDAGLEEINRGTSRYHQRLAFDELLLLQTGLAVLKRGRKNERGISFKSGRNLMKGLLERLTFELTGAQKRVVNEIVRDMEAPLPMNRLIQGDVGSGKTVVALLAMVHAVESGYQAALMAPTEILAEQHHINISRMVKGLNIRTALITGGVRERLDDEIARGEVDVIVGTHALIQEEVGFHKLGLVIIDEQHRFGVMQRAMLRKKGSFNIPDVLVMTATPIPRTLSLTLYGDLDCSVIDELPPGRRPVVTKLFNEGTKGRLYGFIRSEVKKGRQAYIVYPAIEESEKTNLKSAIPAREGLEKIFPDLNIGLIHGRMKPQEREDVMGAFKDGKLDILVSTTVVEVGVDVPNAAIMLVVHAERFGLAQLHQLRGRVGRGAHQSYCFLLYYGRLSEEADRRLQVMIKYSDGFRIAEEDFSIRGPGEFFGTRQAGIPDFKVANLIRDSRILDAARKEAFNIIGNDPSLSSFPQLRGMVKRFWQGKVEIFRTG
ncbi:MAG TPA: ATP-dependent DNA helicase RecG [Nitrospirae bacterium]|nr:ATP-dependent DNA helicase RecG [bacterium BMS3Abin08]HDY72457.1 ATP-dependent DNA helicase RecG [Nitrospirota bacterium]